MGRRRLRLLSRFFPELSLAAVDNRADRREAAVRDFGCTLFEGVEDALENFSPQVLVVSTPPESHATFLTEAFRRGLHTFSELDLVDDCYDEIISIEERGVPVAFLSSTMLYRLENRWIIQNHAMVGERKHYTYHVGQYLPDWHPWEKYDEFFVGSARTNAIREILCIELPWVLRAFGDIAEYQCQWGKTSSLSLPYPDTCQLLFRHTSGNMGALTIDCVSRRPVRNLRINGEEGTILWEGNAESLRFFPPSGDPLFPLREEKEIERQAGYAEFISEGPYLEELRCFFDMIEGRASRVYGYAEHRKILRLADAFERAWRKA
jgi:predicted dehydrogenase